MKFDQHEEEVEAEDLLNLTSMIDVVFTLLAFFIITIRVFGNEREAIVAPAASSAPGIVQGDLPQNILVLLRDNAGQMRIQIGGREFTEPAGVTAQLEQINLPDVSVTFAASPNLSVQQVTSAVDAALQSPMKKISLREISAEDLSGGAR